MAIFDPIFGSEDRRTPPHLRSSEPKIEEPPHLQSSIPEDRRTPPSSMFGPEEWVEDRTEEGGWDFFLRRTKNPPIFHFLGRRTKNPPHLPPSWPEEWTKNPLWYFFFRPPPSHQLPPAILRSGSSDRSSTLKIGPKIEIGHLLCRTHNPDRPRAGRARAADDGVSGRGELGRMGRRRFCPPKEQPSLLPLRPSETTVLKHFSEARRSETLIKPKKEQNPRLIRGLSAGRRPLSVPGC